MLPRSAHWVVLAFVFGLNIVGAKEYAPGVTDQEIKLGQTMPFSGPVSPLGTTGKAELNYFDMINANGGVNGRKIKLISLQE